MKAPRLAAVAAASAAALIFAGCGSGNDVQNMTPAHAPNLSLVRPAFGEADLVPASYPAEIVKLRGAEEIVTGSVEGIEQGRNLYLADNHEDLVHMIVLRVRVSEVLLDKVPGAIQDGYVYVELFQGANTSSGPRFPLSVWRKAIPVGTKTILFLYTHPMWSSVASDIVDNGRGRPDGTMLLGPDSEGMIFEFNGRLYSAAEEQNDGLNPWGMHSIDEVAQNVKDHL